MAKRPDSQRRFSGNHPLSSKDAGSKTMPASAAAHGHRPKVNAAEIAESVEADLEDLVFDLDTPQPSGAEGFDERIAEAAETGVEVLTIIYEGTTYKFARRVVPHGDIETQTKVDPRNERQQHWLKPISLGRLARTIKRRGQIFPALCYRDKKGVIWVIDGSRRRKACILGGSDFIAYVCDSEFPAELVSLLSSEANEHQAPSLIERGISWLQEMDRDALEQKDIASKYKLNAATVSIGVKGAKLPRDIVDLFPSPSGIGRDMITKLHKLLDGLDTETLSKVYEHFKPEVETIDTESMNESACNQKAYALLDVSVQKSVAKANNVKDMYRVNQGFGAKSMRGSFKVTSTGKATLTMTKPSRSGAYEAVKAIAGEYLKEDADLLALIEERISKSGGEE